MKRQRKGSFASARRKASLAMVRDAGEFEEDGAGFDHGDVVFDRALALSPFGLRRASW
jgi:hypothetical protein